MTPAKLKSLTVILVILFILLGILKPTVIEAGDSCTVVVSPSSVQANTTTPFNFALTNTGSGTIMSIKITRPSTNFLLENFGVSGWNVSANSFVAELSGGSVNAGVTYIFSYYATSGNTEASSANWQLETNSGAGYVACSGALGTGISGVADVTAPSISDPSVSSITSTSAVITWTTNEPATTSVDYGLTEDYGLTVSDPSLVISHTITLTGLSANTVYTFDIYSADASGNTSRNSQNMLTTASTVPGATTIPATITTVTTTTTGTTTATVVKADTTGPSVVVSTKFDKPFDSAPLIEGKASDFSGVSKVEYSTDGGANWLPVNDFESGKSATFSFIPDIYEDGNYEIFVRGTDSYGNRGSSKRYVLIFDRLPPLIGGNLISLGPLILMPNENGVIITMAGIEQKITLSAVGGPVTVDLFANGRMYSIPKVLDTGLWSGIINFPQKGIYSLTTKSVDGAGNQTERKLNDVVVVEPGLLRNKVTQDSIKEAKISLYYNDPYSDTWVVWDASPFGQENPQITEEDGLFRYFLPAGKYYFKINAPGYYQTVSDIFTLKGTTPVSFVFDLDPLKSIQIGKFKINLPSWTVKRWTVSIATPALPTKETGSSLIGKDAPLFILPSTFGEFNLASLRGKPTLLSFVSTWSPPSLEQLAVLNQLDSSDINSVIITEGEASSKISIFQKLGAYDLPLVIDSDATLIEKYSIQTLPTHFFLDKKGIVQEIVTGVLNKEEILAISNTN